MADIGIMAAAEKSRANLDERRKGVTSDSENVKGG
jgi:hypothetical protein